MKLKLIDLHNIGGIQSLMLTNINQSMNIICGENGVGKTTLLDSISHLFTNYYSSVLRKNVASELGGINAYVKTDESEEYVKVEMVFNQHKPDKTNQINGLSYLSNKMIMIKVNREFNYQQQPSINKDSERNHGELGNNCVNGIYYQEIKSWFLHRYLFSGHIGGLKEEQLSNFNLAKKCFSILNSEFSFSRVDTDEHEIMINTPSGEIYYEYLSSGFKSVISIVFGIIKEIELRFKNPYMFAEDFDGIIAIDEIEQHLHPEWQGRACSILKEIFPKAQFFISTHSPHVVQTALNGEVIALERIDSQVIRRELPASEDGYQGWTIEEILRDVMGMNDLRTKKYENIRDQFLKAFKERNIDEAKSAFNALQKMLHPSSELRAIYQMQLDSIGD